MAYRFFNNAPQNKTVTVAFPMPDISNSGLDDNLALPDPQILTIFRFSTRADGQPVETRLEQRVFAKGVDQTELLRRLGASPSPQLELTMALMRSLSHNGRS